jgi:hypothetical protein
MKLMSTSQNWQNKFGRSLTGFLLLGVVVSLIFGCDSGEVTTIPKKTTASSVPPDPDESAGPILTSNSQPSDNSSAANGISVTATSLSFDPETCELTDAVLPLGEGSISVNVLERDDNVCTFEYTLEVDGGYSVYQVTVSVHDGMVIIEVAPETNKVTTSFDLAKATIVHFDAPNENPSLVTAVVEELAPQASGLCLAEVVDVVEFDESSDGGFKGVRVVLEKVKGSGDFYQEFKVEVDSGISPNVRADSFKAGLTYWIAFAASDKHERQPIVRFWRKGDNKRVEADLDKAVSADVYRWSRTQDPATGLVYGRAVDLGDGARQWRIRVTLEGPILWEKLVVGTMSDRPDSWGLQDLAVKSKTPDENPPAEPTALKQVLVAETIINLATENEFALAPQAVFIRETYELESGARLSSKVIQYSAPDVVLLYREYDSETGEVKEEPAGVDIEPTILTKVNSVVQLSLSKTDPIVLASTIAKTHADLDISLGGGDTCFKVKYIDPNAPNGGAGDPKGVGKAGEPRQSFESLGNSTRSAKPFEGILTFKLTPMLEDVNASSWQILVFPDRRRIARIYLDAKKSALMFEWDSFSHGYDETEYLQNCILRLRPADSPNDTIIRLRETASAEGAKVHFADRSRKASFELKHLPPPETLHLEVTGLSAGFPKFFQSPPAPITLPRDARKLNLGDGSTGVIRLNASMNSDGELQVVTRAFLNLQIHPDPIPLSDERLASVGKSIGERIAGLKANAKRIAKVKGRAAAKQRVAITREVRKYSTAAGMLNQVRGWRNSVGDEGKVNVRLYTVVDSVTVDLLRTK